MRTTIVLAITLAVISSLTAYGQEIKVAAAADLNYALQDLAGRFEQKTGHHVALSFGSSGNLYSQIKAGAPFDVFFSADMQYPQKLADEGLITPPIRTYAVGHLVLWVPNSLGLDPQTLKMDLLANSKVNKIAIANPEHAPYGRAAIAALEHFGLKDKLAPKMVYGENVSQAAQFAQSGNAQAALIALSLASSPSMKSAGAFWEVPLDAYPPLKQGVGVVAASKQKATAQAFVDYVTSPEAAPVLKQYGFGSAQ